MKVAVVGVGAMGGALAAEAAAAGHEVSVLDVSVPLVETIGERGIIVRYGDRELVQRVPATTDPGQIGIADVVVVFVKSQHTRAAVRSIPMLRDEGTVVASLQNGWGNSDVLAAELGTDRLVFGVTYQSCTVIDPATVFHSGRGDSIVGPYDGRDFEAAHRVADLLTSAGWSGHVSPEVRTDIWKKLILNAATLPTAALTGLPAGALILAEPMRELIDAIALEACTVAKAMGLAVDAAERIDRIHAVLAAAGSGRASMLQDTEARRRTEIDVINGAVVRAAAQWGIDVPVNRALTALIGGLEQSWSR